MFKRKHRKNIILTVPIENEVNRSDNSGEEITKNISYILQYIDSQGLWQAHYDIFWIIFLKEFIKLNANRDTMIKKCENCRKKCKYCDCFLEYTNFKNDLI